MKPLPTGDSNPRVRLNAQLEEARAAYGAARERFDQLSRQGHTGLPHPDGVLSIQQASRSEREALQKYMEALKRLSHFLIEGTLPPED